jgi:hypothetical protein
MGGTSKSRSEACCHGLLRCTIRRRRKESSGDDGAAQDRWTLEGVRRWASLRPDPLSGRTRLRQPDGCRILARPRCALSLASVFGRFSWWDSEDRLTDGVGYFREIVSPRADQFETLYTYTQADKFPGVGAIMDGVSSDIQEHGYWGSMRDRIPLSQTDWPQPHGTLEMSL